MGTSMLGKAAALAKKRAELAALNNVALPRVYQQIGRRIAGLAKLPPDLAGHVERIRQLEATVGPSSLDTSTVDDSGFAAKAKQLAHKAAKATSDAATTLKINSAYATLGREAVLKYGEKAAPKEMTAELSALNAKQEALTAEIAALEASHAGGIVTPKRLVLAATFCGVLLGGFVVVRSVGSLFSGAGPRAVQQPAMPALPDLGEITVRPKKAKARTGDALSAVTEELSNLTDTLQQEAADAKLQDLAGVERQWKQKAAEFGKQLIRDSQIVSVRSDMAKEAREAFDTKAADRERTLAALLDRSEESIQSALGAAREQLSGGHSDKAGAGSDPVQQFREACEKASKSLTEARSKAVNELCELANAAKASQQKLAGELEREYASAVESWAAKAAALGDITTDKAITDLNTPKDVVNWKSRISNTQDQLTFKLNYLVDQQKAKAAEWAAAEASRFTVADDVGAFRQNAMKSLSTHMEAALREVQELRASKIAEVASHHSEAMQEQASRESSEAAEKARRGRSYEAPADLTDAELAEIIKAAPDITDLGLVRATKLTDACMPAIASLKNLRALYLSNRRFHVDENPHITAKGLSLLKGKKLRELTVPDRIFQDDEGFLVYVDTIADIRSCEVYWHEADVLRLDNARVSESVLDGLRNMPNILGLTLPTRVSDRGLETLQHFPQLRRVDFYVTKTVTDAGIRSLAKCKNLRMITMWLPSGVTDIHITPEAIQALNGMNLAWFVVPRAMHADKFFEPVLNTLASEEVQTQDGHPLDFMRRELYLVDPREAFDAQIAASNPDSREHVISSMWEWPCTPTVLKACAGKDGVEEVHIKECDVDENALASVGMLPDLKELFIFKTDITGSGLESLPNAAKLKRVEISGCRKFSRAGIAALSRCQSLERLTLSEVPLLTDADLLLLANCKRLKRLIVSESEASALLLVKLQNAMPQCEIDISP
jgi:hypothetical protein